MLNRILSLSSFSFLIAGPILASAHGGITDNSRPKPEKSKAVIHRAPSSAPEGLDSSELQSLASMPQLPEDVAVLYCKLGEFSECRGMIIQLSDLAGKDVASSHTGLNGIAAFKGLRPNTTYIAKIDGEKYAGEIGIKGGAQWSLWAARK